MVLAGHRLETANNEVTCKNLEMNLLPPNGIRCARGKNAVEKIQTMRLLSVGDAIFDRFSVDSFHTKMTEQNFYRYEEVSKRTEEWELATYSVNSDEEIQFPESVQQQSILT